MKVLRELFRGQQTKREGVFGSTDKLQVAEITVILVGGEMEDAEVQTAYPAVKHYAPLGKVHTNSSIDGRSLLQSNANADHVVGIQQRVIQRLMYDISSTT